MATVILTPFHWQANMNATFALARRLRRNRHRVLYLVIPDSIPRIEQQGFEALPVFEQVFPPGAISAEEAREARGTYGGMPAFRARIQAMCDLMERGELDRALGDLRPDLFVVPAGSPWLGMGAWKTGVPVALYSSNLLSIRDPIVPPYSTGLVPSGPLNRLRTRMAWTTIIAGRRWLDPYRLRIHDDLEQFARRLGFPADGIDFEVETWPILQLPHLVLCPAEFDFRRSRVPPRTAFVEPGVDVERRDPEFPWEWLDSGRPLAYCALGSVAGFRFAPEAARLHQAFLDAVNERKGWQGVAAIGRHIEPDQLRCPPNARIVREAPQLALMAKASVTVCHGGFSTVKEAIFHGVPIVVLPLSYDHPGAAARVVHHGLGIRDDFASVTSARLGARMDAVLSERSMRERAQRMSSVFRTLQERSPGAEILEGLLRDSVAVIDGRRN
jgi:zeaxanthin glucosyltransferase